MKQKGVTWATKPLILPPTLQGRLDHNVSMAKMTWLCAGGAAPWVYHPCDAEDLGRFVQFWNQRSPLYVIGAGSNLLVREQLDGAVIKLGRGFRHFQLTEEGLVLGAGLLNRYVTQQCQTLGLGGLEFMNTIPGSIGGGLAMNAGCYGSCVADRLIWARVMDPVGHTHCLSVAELNYGYRTCGLPQGWFFLEAMFRVHREDPAVIGERMAQWLGQREATQPLHVKTGGSTFANPPHHSAWKLIDHVGFRGKRLGDAQFSQKHCNFLINRGQATAWELETLAERAKQAVHNQFGISLQWEIVRWGSYASCVKEPLSFHETDPDQTSPPPSLPASQL